MECRPACAACCIAPSIGSPIPGMPHGKPAGVRCVQLSAEDRCLLFNHPDRPAFCLGFQATPEVCGADRAEALANLIQLERATAP